MAGMDLASVMLIILGLIMGKGKSLLRFLSGTGYITWPYTIYKAATMNLAPVKKAILGLILGLRKPPRHYIGHTKSS